MSLTDNARKELDDIIDSSGGEDMAFAESPLQQLLFDGSTAQCVLDGLKWSQLLCHGLAARSGWWTSRLTGKPLDYSQVNIGEKLMLIVSEVAEAMEGDRKNLMDDKLPHRKMLEVELADALIRIFDLAGFLQCDLAGAVIEKLAFNQQRADHKIENRNAPGGKAY